MDHQLSPEWIESNVYLYTLNPHDGVSNKVIVSYRSRTQSIQTKLGEAS